MRGPHNDMASACCKAAARAGAEPFHWLPPFFQLPTAIHRGAERGLSSLPLLLSENQGLALLRLKH